MTPADELRKAANTLDNTPRCGIKDADWGCDCDCDFTKALIVALRQEAQRTHPRKPNLIPVDALLLDTARKINALETS